jgi:hypothetical protein
MRNDQIIQPCNGYHTSMSFPSIESLTQGYFGEGPRVTVMYGLSQKTWSVDIFKELATPIVERGGEKGALAQAILKH